MAADDQMGWREQFSLSREIKANLRVLPTRELNSETPAELLDQRITPIDLLFVRNTGRMPAFSRAEIENWTLTIDGEVERPQRWTIDELKAVGSRNVIAVLECAGNGRAYFPCNRLINFLDAKAMALDGMISRIPFAKPYQFARSFRPRWKKWPWFAGTVMWADGAVGCIEWTGVPLAALLQRSGVKAGAVYTGHHSADLALGGTSPALSRGLPIAKALHPDTLVAWAMNGEDIPAIHGGPLRLVAPGYPGSAWQKWIDRIEIRDRVHDGRLMEEYRIDGEVIEEMPVNCVITRPANGFATRTGQPLGVGGYAWSGRSGIGKVGVSVDGGASWREAVLGEAPAGRFAWRRFDIEFAELAPGPVEIIVRAHDQDSEQPLTSRSRAGNPIGYCNNVARRVRGRVV
ncbi:sulfite oxidase [Bradyrhizobium sp.]|jgi:DMSO/TMAO reductase YedYZ molybdopterin-dependent catalytic subunit|uniref:sulfite oxidase n=1 Tax=Bradyrhizobium sp. TaxID=376 RepID=UPI002DFB4194|nr:sulfite oxidase [Bradyrhizobium sp.]